LGFEFLPFGISSLFRISIFGFFRPGSSLSGLDVDWGLDLWVCHPGVGVLGVVEGEGLGGGVEGLFGAGVGGGGGDGAGVGAVGNAGWVVGDRAGRYSAAGA